jgi:hypothetical protein
MRQLQLRMSMAVVLASCASGVVEPERGERPPPVRQSTATLSRLGGVGHGLVPYQHPELWPLQVSSARVVAHYRAAGEQAMAEEILGHVEHAWQVQIDRGGALPPLDDHGVAGPDGRFDVYLWRGIDTLYVDGIAPDDTTWYGDWSTFMVLDPWGQYGGAELEANIFHELRHASQGSDDWWEHIHAFEAEATLWEVAYYGFERLPLVWRDYQAHPEWTLFRDDGYRTWYMYGGALFLLYLRDHAFHGDLSFSNDMWRRCRNAPGADVAPRLNQPDFADALQAMLAAKGSSLFDEVLGFARTRWYTGTRANGSLPGGAVLPEVAHRTHTRRAGARQTRFSVSPQMLGTSYVVVERAATDPAALWVSLSTNNRAARFAVQTVGGGGDATLDLGAGPAHVSFGARRAATFAVTALPAGGTFDPDLVSGAPMTASLTLSTTR